MTGTTILVVDDHANDGLELIQILSENGADVFLVRKSRYGQAAFQTAETVDVTIVDAAAPFQDGIDSTCEIRQHDSYVKIPIVALAPNIKL